MSTVTTEKLSPDERKAILARVIAFDVGSGCRVESQTDYSAVLVRGHRPNHVLHLILTIITLGLWAIIWILVAIFGGEKRFPVTIDEYGHVLR